MTKIVLTIPPNLDLKTALQLSAKIPQTEECQELLLDFQYTRLVEPFAMLLFSSEVTHYMYQCPNTQVGCVNIQHMGYAAHMGFFKAFHIPYGKAPGEAKGNVGYVPLTIFHTQNIIDIANSKALEIGDVVEAESKRLAQTLCHANEGDLYDTLSYSIRELIRNVVEHSKSNQFGFCAQYWPTKNKAEVAILDRGIGIQKSLSDNPHIDVSDNKKALNYALMPAISGKAFKGARQKQKGPWANSGFGLYMTNRICRNGGSFFIASGNSGMQLFEKSEAKQYHNCDLHGTAIRMEIKTNKLTGLKDSLLKYRHEGYEIQQKYNQIVNIDPSAASLMLSTDFDLSVWDKIVKKIKTRNL